AGRRLWVPDPAGRRHLFAGRTAPPEGEIGRGPPMLAVRPRIVLLLTLCDRVAPVLGVAFVTSAAEGTGRQLDPA
ncbi:MAG: hypothetical protein ACRDT1_17950, partial [Micromonosporaceae bacterium]